MDSLGGNTSSNAGDGDGKPGKGCLSDAQQDVSKEELDLSEEDEAARAIRDALAAAIDAASPSVRQFQAELCESGALRQLYDLAMARRPLAFEALRLLAYRNRIVVQQLANMGAIELLEAVLVREARSGTASGQLQAAALQLLTSLLAFNLEIHSLVMRTKLVRRLVLLCRPGTSEASQSSQQQQDQQQGEGRGSSGHRHPEGAGGDDGAGASAGEPRANGPAPGGARSGDGRQASSPPPQGGSLGSSREEPAPAGAGRSSAASAATHGGPGPGADHLAAAAAGAGAGAGAGGVSSPSPAAGAGVAHPDAPVILSEEQQSMAACAAVALRNLCHQIANHPGLLSAGAALELAAVMQREPDPYRRINATMAVALLVGHEEAHPLMRMDEAGMREMLMVLACSRAKVMCHGYFWTCWKVCQALARLSANEDNKQVLTREGGVEVLADVLLSEEHSRKAITVKYCMEALWNLAFYEPARQQILSNAALLEAIRGALQSGLDLVREVARGCLFTLGVADYGGGAARRSGGQVQQQALGPELELGVGVGGDGGLVAAAAGLQGEALDASPPPLPYSLSFPNPHHNHQHHNLHSYHQQQEQLSHSHHNHHYQQHRQQQNYNRRQSLDISRLMQDSQRLRAVDAMQGRGGGSGGGAAWAAEFARQSPWAGGGGGGAAGFHNLPGTLSVQSALQMRRLDASPLEHDGSAFGSPAAAPVADWQPLQQQQPPISPRRSGAELQAPAGSGSGSTGGGGGGGGAPLHRSNSCASSQHRRGSFSSLNAAGGGGGGSAAAAPDSPTGYGRAYGHSPGSGSGPGQSNGHRNGHGLSHSHSFSHAGAPTHGSALTSHPSLTVAPHQLLHQQQGFGHLLGGPAHMHSRSVTMELGGGGGGGGTGYGNGNGPVGLVSPMAGEGGHGGGGGGGGEAGHIMISYEWGSQQKALMIKEALERRGLLTWMDVEKMSGSTLEAMALAVEGATAVLLCITKRYKESQACRAEAEYAFQQRKRIIPIMMERGYRPTGWLGILIGTKLYFDFSERRLINEKVASLERELGPLVRLCRRPGSAASASASAAAGRASRPSSAHISSSSPAPPYHPHHQHPHSQQHPGGGAHHGYGYPNGNGNGNAYSNRTQPGGGRNSMGCPAAASRAASVAAYPATGGHRSELPSPSLSCYQTAGGRPRRGSGASYNLPDVPYDVGGPSPEAALSAAGADAGVRYLRGSAGAFGCGGGGGAGSVLSSVDEASADPTMHDVNDGADLPARRLAGLGMLGDSPNPEASQPGEEEPPDDEAAWQCGGAPTDPMGPLALPPLPPLPPTAPRLAAQRASGSGAVASGASDGGAAGAVARTLKPPAVSWAEQSRPTGSAALPEGGGDAAVVVPMAELSAAAASAAMGAVGDTTSSSGGVHGLTSSLDQSPPSARQPQHGAAAGLGGSSPSPAPADSASGPTAETAAGMEPEAAGDDDGGGGVLGLSGDPLMLRLPPAVGVQRLRDAAARGAKATARDGDGDASPAGGSGTPQCYDPMRPQPFGPGNEDDHHHNNHNHRSRHDHHQNQHSCAPLDSDRGAGQAPHLPSNEASSSGRYCPNGARVTHLARAQAQAQEHPADAALDDSDDLSVPPPTAIMSPDPRVNPAARLAAGIGVRWSEDSPSPGAGAAAAAEATPSSVVRSSLSRYRLRRDNTSTSLGFTSEYATSVCDGNAGAPSEMDSGAVVPAEEDQLSAPASPPPSLPPPPAAGQLPLPASGGGASLLGAAGPADALVGAARALGAASDAACGRGGVAAAEAPEGPTEGEQAEQAAGRTPAPMARRSLRRPDGADGVGSGGAGGGGGGGGGLLQSVSGGALESVDGEAASTDGQTQSTSTPQPGGSTGDLLGLPGGSGAAEQFVAALHPCASSDVAAVAAALEAFDRALHQRGKVQLPPSQQQQPQGQEREQQQQQRLQGQSLGAGDGVARSAGDPAAAATRTTAATAAAAASAPRACSPDVAALAKQPPPQQQPEQRQQPQQRQQSTAPLAAASARSPFLSLLRPVTAALVSAAVALTPPSAASRARLSVLERTDTVTAVPTPFARGHGSTTDDGLAFASSTGGPGSVCVAGSLPAPAAGFGSPVGSGPGLNATVGAARGGGSAVATLPLPQGAAAGAAAPSPAETADAVTASGVATTTAASAVPPQGDGNGGAAAAAAGGGGGLSALRWKAMTWATRRAAADATVAASRTTVTSPDSSGGRAEPAVPPPAAAATLQPAPSGVDGDADDLVGERLAMVMDSNSRLSRRTRASIDESSMAGAVASLRPGSSSRGQHGYGPDPHAASHGPWSQLSRDNSRGRRPGGGGGAGSEAGCSGGRDEEASEGDVRLEEALFGGGLVGRLGSASGGGAPPPPLPPQPPHLRRVNSRRSAGPPVIVEEGSGGDSITGGSRVSGGMGAEGAALAAGGWSRRTLGADWDAQPGAAELDGGGLDRGGGGGGFAPYSDRLSSPLLMRRRHPEEEELAGSGRDVGGGGGDEVSGWATSARGSWMDGHGGGSSGGGGGSGGRVAMEARGGGLGGGAEDDATSDNFVSQRSSEGLLEGHGELEGQEGGLDMGMGMQMAAEMEVEVAVPPSSTSQLVERWKAPQVRDWLVRIGHCGLADRFEEQGITGRALCGLMRLMRGGGGSAVVRDVLRQELGVTGLAAQLELLEELHRLFD